jgi:hypothetical protein
LSALIIGTAFLPKRTSISAPSPVPAPSRLKALVCCRDGHDRRIVGVVICEDVTDCMAESFEPRPVATGLSCASVGSGLDVSPHDVVSIAERCARFRDSRQIACPRRTVIGLEALIRRGNCYD